MSTHASESVESSAARGSAMASRTGLVLVSLGAVCWGTGGVAGVLLSRQSDLEPLAVAAFRLLVGGSVVVLGLLGAAMVRGRRVRLPRGRTAWRRIAAVGALSAVYQSCYFAAVALTSVSVATLVTLGSAPLMVVTAETILTRQRPRRAVIIALALAVAGLLLLVGRPDQVAAAGGGGASVAVGVGLALTSAAGFATITLLGIRPVPGLTAVPLTGFAFTFGGILLAPVALVTGTLAFDVTTPNVALVVFLGLIPTATAYGLFFSGVRAVGAGPASLLSLLEPITAAVLGWAVLDESLGGVGVIGAALVAAAVVLARPRPARGVAGRGAAVVTDPA